MKEEHESEATMQKITTKSKNEPHTRILRKYYHVLAARMCGTTTCLQGKTVLL